MTRLANWPCCEAFVEKPIALIGHGGFCGEGDLAGNPFTRHYFKLIDYYYLEIP